MLRSQKSQETVKSETDKAWLMIFGSLQVKTATTNNKITLSFCFFVFFFWYIFQDQCFSQRSLREVLNPNLLVQAFLPVGKRTPEETEVSAGLKV